MDPVCHTLAGAAFGRAGLARRSRLGMATLVIAANLPDIDVAVLATNTLAVSFRRGWTHGILGQVLLPPILAGIMVLGSRLRSVPQQPAERVRFGWLLVMAYVGVLSHVGLDWLNSYGVRLLMPLSSRWFYGDALFVVDPWIYLALGGGLWFARQRTLRQQEDPDRPARAGLWLAVAYVALMVAANHAARGVVQAGLVRAGQRADTRFMVTPVFANPIKREVVIDMGDHYEKGLVWFLPMPRFRPGGFGLETELQAAEVQAAIDSPRARAFLSWSRFPFARVDPSQSPPRVWLNDFRYANSGPLGWSALLLDGPRH